MKKFAILWICLFISGGGTGVWAEDTSQLGNSNPPAVQYVSHNSSSEASESLKTFFLKDGSQIKGKLIRFENAIYTIQTPHLGVVTLNEADMRGISSQEVPLGFPANAYGSQTMGNFHLPVSSPGLSGFPGSPYGNASYKEEVQGMQHKLLSDPAFMTDMQNLVTDPEVMQLLNDPQLLQDLMSYDVQKIQGNPKVHSLLQNPKIQSLMNRMNQMYSPASSPP